MYRLKIPLLVFLIAGLGSCDLLENQQPQQSLPFQGGLDTVEELQNALTGTYNDLQDIEGTNFAQVLFASDIIADDVIWTGSFPTYTEIASQEMTVLNGSIEDHWNGAYTAINDANIILSRLPELDDPNATEEVVNNLRGEALFIRALEYYYLVQTFAKPWGATSDNSHMGVPLQLEQVTSADDFQNPSRATVAQVYAQIITDLQEAQGLLTTNTPNKATAGAATALLARIALIQERWSDAATLAGQVINDYNYELLPEVTTYFREELSAESIFEIENTVQDVVDPSNTSITAVYHEETRDDIQISENYVEALDNIITDDQEAALSLANLSAYDTRDSLLLTGTIADTSNTTKYESNINADDNLPVLRLSEIILTRAEALAETDGVNQASIDLLNQIRTRAIVVTDSNGDPVTDETLIEYQLTDFASAQELIDAILLERRVELAFEGHRKIDLQRRHLDVRGTAWDADILTFPIPLSQTDANENIKQNPAYL